MLIPKCARVSKLRGRSRLWLVEAMMCFAFIMDARSNQTRHTFLPLPPIGRMKHFYLLVICVCCLIGSFVSWLHSQNNGAQPVTVYKVEENARRSVTAMNQHKHSGINTSNAASNSGRAIPMLSGYSKKLSRCADYGNVAGNWVT